MSKVDPSEFYSPGNLDQVVPFLPREPRWLLLGGPADAREAQRARELWPGIKVVGVEPNARAIEFQLAHGWPEGCPLVHAALWSEVGEVSLAPGESLRHDSVRTHLKAPPPANVLPVKAVTWDHLDGLYGPFEEALMWMDIEGSELPALRGARRLLERGAVMVINVELMQRPENPESMDIQHMVKGFLSPLDFLAVKDWNDSRFCRDRVFVKVRPKVIPR